MIKITADAVPGGMLVLNGESDQAADEVVRAYFDLPTVQKKWVGLPLSGLMPMLDGDEGFVTVVGQLLLYNRGDVQHECCFEEN